MPVKGKGMGCNRTELATVFGKTTATIDAWVRRGCPYVSKATQGKPWRFNTAAVIEWREQEVARVTGGDSDSVDLQEARRRKLVAEAEKAEMEIMRSDYFKREDVDDAICVLVTNTKMRIETIPSRAAPLVAPEAPGPAEKIIRGLVREALTALSQVEVSPAPADGKQPKEGIANR